jgi:hypothetical protein
MTEYVIKSKRSLLEEYALLVADRVNFLDHDVEYELSHTDTVQDATNFLFVNEALYAMETLKLNEDDWEVVEVGD